MAQYAITIQSTRAPSEAFDYLAEFSRAVEWDPNVKEGRRLPPAQSGVAPRSASSRGSWADRCPSSTR